MNIQGTNRVLEAYQHLLQAEKNKKSVTPITDLYPDITIHDAYLVQMKSIHQMDVKQKHRDKSIKSTFLHIVRSVFFSNSILTKISCRKNEIVEIKNVSVS